MIGRTTKNLHLPQRRSQNSLFYLLFFVERPHHDCD